MNHHWVCEYRFKCLRLNSLLSTMKTLGWSQHRFILSILQQWLLIGFQLFCGRCPTIIHCSVRCSWKPRASNLPKYISFPQLFLCVIFLWSSWCCLTWDSSRAMVLFYLFIFLHPVHWLWACSLRICPTARVPLKTRLGRAKASSKIYLTTASIVTGKIRLHDRYEIFETDVDL